MVILLPNLTQTFILSKSENTAADALLHGQCYLGEVMMLAQQSDPKLKQLQDDLKLL